MKQSTLAEVPEIPAGEHESKGSILGRHHIITQNSVIAIAGGIVSQALKFLVILSVARSFSSGQFGSFSFAMAVNAYVFVVSQFGLPVFGARAVAKAGHVSSDLLRAITWARAFLALLGLGVALASLSFLHGVRPEELFLVTALGLSNLALAGFYDWAFQGLGRLGVYAILNTAWQSLWLVLTVVSSHEGGGIVGVGIAFSASALLASGLSYLWLKQSTAVERDDRIDGSAVRASWEILKSGAALGVGTMLITVLIWTDAITVRLLRGDHAAGVYAAGNRTALSLAMLASFYVLGALPHLSQASAGELSCFARFFQRTYDDLALLFVPGALWAIFYAPEIIQLLFKQKDYLAGASVFRIFQVVLIVNVISNLYGIGGLVAHGRDRAYQKVLMISAGAFVLLCPPLTMAWGIEGAALAVLSSQLLSLALFLFEARGLVPSSHGQALLVPALLGAGVGLANRSLGLPLFEGAAVMVIAYAILLALRARSIWRDRVWRTSSEAS